jgi:hypothetical protein
MLVVATFRGWYGLDGTYLSAWDLLEFGRCVLLATAAAALVLLLVVASGAAARQATAERSRVRQGRRVSTGSVVGRFTFEVKLMP